MISVNYDSLRKNFHQINIYIAGTDLKYAGKIYNEEDRVIYTLNTGTHPHICFGSLLAAWGVWNRSIASFRSAKNVVFYINAPTVQSERSLLHTWMSSDELKEFVSKFAEDVSLNIKVSVEKSTMFFEDSSYVVEISTSPEIRYMDLKLLLFWLRNAIKFPYNYLLADAITLKEKYLPEEELYNLLRVVIFCVRSGRRTGVRSTFGENFSPWGPILDLQTFKEEIRTKKSINYWSDGGIFPIAGTSDLNWRTTTSPKTSGKLQEEETFRSSILEELPYLMDDDSGHIYNINNLLDTDNRFDTYLKVYNFKKELWK